ATTAKPVFSAARAAELVAKANRARTSLQNYREQVESSKVPSALVGGGCVVVGGAVAGAVRGFRDEVLGLPTDAVLGLVAGGVGIGLGRPSLIFGGAGALALY